MLTYTCNNCYNDYDARENNYDDLCNHCKFNKNNEINIDSFCRTLDNNWPDGNK